MYFNILPKDLYDDRTAAHISQSQIEPSGVQQHQSGYERWCALQAGARAIFE